ncbi:hypothetical protein PCE1_004175 [Barthelona sp. PCE]
MFTSYSEEYEQSPFNMSQTLLGAGALKSERSRASSVFSANKLNTEISEQFGHFKIPMPRIITLLGGPLVCDSDSFSAFLESFEELAVQNIGE